MVKSKKVKIGDKSEQSIQAPDVNKNSNKTVAKSAEKCKTARRPSTRSKSLETEFNSIPVAKRKQLPNELINKNVDKGQVSTNVNNSTVNSVNNNATVMQPSLGQAGTPVIGSSRSLIRSIKEKRGNVAPKKVTEAAPHIDILKILAKPPLPRLTVNKETAVPEQSCSRAVNDNQARDWDGDGIEVEVNPSDDEYEQFSDHNDGVEEPASNYLSDDSSDDEEVTGPGTPCEFVNDDVTQGNGEDLSDLQRDPRVQKLLRRAFGGSKEVTKAKGNTETPKFERIRRQSVMPKSVEQQQTPESSR